MEVLITYLLLQSIVLLSATSEPTIREPRLAPNNRTKLQIDCVKLWMNWCHYCIRGPQAIEGGSCEGEGGAHPAEVPLAGVRAEGDRLQLQEPRAQGQGTHLQALLVY